MTAEDDVLFKEITDAAMADESLKLLSKQLDRTRKWRDQRLTEGESANLHDLIKQVMKEPNKRRHVLVAYCAALWSLMEDDEIWGDDVG